MISNRSSSKKDDKIIISIELNSAGLQDSVKLAFRPIKDLEISDLRIAKRKPNCGSAKWEIFSAEPLMIYTNDFLNGQRASWLIESGDSIVIKYDEKRLVFSGKGYDKFVFQQKIDDLKNSISRPANLSKFTTTSLNDYFEWNSYLDKCLRLLTPIADSFRYKVSDYAYNYIRVGAISRFEEHRLDKFWSLVGSAEKLGVTKKDLCNIFDSSFYKHHARWMRSMEDFTPGWYAFIRAEVFRKYTYDFAFDSLRDEAKRRFLYYEQGNKTYKGLAREKFLIDFLTDHTIYEIGLTKETKLLLNKYYSEPGYGQYKKYVKLFEQNANVFRNGRSAPTFTLIDKEGSTFNKEHLNGRVCIMDFWFTGCVGCAQLANVMQKVERQFFHDTNVVFLNISVDKDKGKWLSSIQRKVYTSGQGISLYTGGEGNDHEMLKAYNINAYPSLYMLDGYGRIVHNPLPDPRSDSGKYLIEAIGHQLELLSDGPYVRYENSKVTLRRIKGRSIIVKEVDKENIDSFDVQSDEYNKPFRVKLKSRSFIEPSEFPDAKKLFVLSDIEGNFGAFRKLLQKNRIIDENYNWTFGEGHLVINGDVFDRGEQVTECLWLIYSLEEKAKVAGGYVHFILGNHEIMNLSGDYRYVHDKYRSNTQKLNIPYEMLFDDNSELGRWLRTKNIVEKIGDVLFVHAGISSKVNDVELSISQINELARPHYAKRDPIKEVSNSSLSVLFDAKISPFWYRLYYQDQEMKTYLNGDTTYKASEEQVHKTLKKFNVLRIITGHTIVADTISMHYDGKVINTDTDHARNKSEALFIRNGEYYRVNSEGMSKLILVCPIINLTRRSSER